MLTAELKIETKPADPVGDNGIAIGLSPNSIRVLKNRYLKKDSDGVAVELPSEMYSRVAHTVAQAELAYGASKEKVEALEKEYVDAMVKGVFLPNSPTIMNAGREMGMLSACFVLPLGDSIDEIFTTVKNTAIIQKAGGGTGFSLDRLRPSGAYIKSSGGTTSGPISFWKVLSEATSAIQQGCFVAGTQIGIPGGKKSIESIKKDDLVYSYDHSKKKLVIGAAASDAFKTKVSTPVWKLTTDKGLVVYATPEHLMMLRSGEYKALSELQPNDRLMPLTRFVKDGELVVHLQDGHDTRVAEHRMIAEYIHGGSVGDFDVHHKDGNHLNNAPENLEVLTRSEHLRLHGKKRGAFYNKGRSGEQNGMHASKFWATASEEKKKELRFKLGVKSRSDNVMKRPGVAASHPLFNDAEVKLKAKRGKMVAAGCRLLERGLSIAEGDWASSVSNLYNTQQFKSETVLGVFGSWETFQAEVQTRNHRVVSVEFSHNADVYDFEVVGTHNFFVVNENGGGVAVHNSFRRGANMAMMSLWHPDILKFLFAKQDKTCFQNYNISVKVTDEWMLQYRKNPNQPNVVTDKRSGKQYVLPKVFSGKATIMNYELGDLVMYDTYLELKQKPEVWTLNDMWDTIVQNAWKTGEPGVAFVDRWHENNPTPNVGEYETTNPCVPAGTRILTQAGYQAIETCVGKKVAVWNGQCWSEVEPRVTGHDQPLTKVSFSDGTELVCTDAHKFVLANGERVSAVELKPGDSLAKFNMPLIEGESEHLPCDAYTHGFFCGDGQTSGHSNGILLYGEKQKLAQFINGNMGSSNVEHDRTYVGLGANYPSKSFVPVNASMKSRLAWLAGLLDADGNTTENPNSVALCLSANGLQFLREVRLLLTTLGVQAKVSEAREAGPRQMTDGHSGMKTYWCEKQYRLLINATDTAKLVSLGLPVKRLVIEKCQPNRDARRFVEVVSTEPAGRADTVYCFTEPLNHTGTFEGIVTAQCGEQILLPHESCNLGSINLGAFVEFDQHSNKNHVDWSGLKKAIHLSTRFLENVVEVNNYSIAEVAKISTENRKIGLGIMGFADALYKLGVAYDSEEGIEWGEKFMKFVNDEAHNESERLAEERGCFANWNGSRWELEWKRKQRNACSTTVAPTGTISIIANCSGGIEPMFSLAFSRSVMKDSKAVAVKMTEVNSVFEAVAEAQNYWGYDKQELFDGIAEEGSLHGFQKVPEAIRRVFVGAHDIAPEWHVKMQAAFQKHCDSSISKTTNFPHSATPEDVRKVYDLAYDMGCKGVTVYRDGCRDEQPMGLNEKAKEVPAPVAAPISLDLKPIKTPSILSAIRLRSRTPFGNMHMTISVDPKSERELEVFAQVGKAGDITFSDLEAICRMVSLWLRAGGSLDHVIEQLDGIGSHLSVGTRDGQVASLGDALAKSLRRYKTAKKLHGLKLILLGEVDLEGVQTQSEGFAVKKMVDELRTNMKVKCPQCHAGTLAYMEGCKKCVSCGYSQC